MSFEFLKNKTIIYLLIFLGCFIVYGNSIQNSYSLDDELVIENNELTQGGIKNIPRIFSGYSFVDKTKNLAFSYRPVTLTTFAIEVSLLGISPHISHFVNILLYTIFCCLLYYFLSLTFPNTPPVILYITLLFFILHPIHTEVVDNIKSRDEILVSIFGIAALIQLVKFISTRNIFRLLAVLVFVIGGLLSKESFYVYMLLLPILYFLLEEKKYINFKNIGIILVASFGAVIAIAFIKGLLLSDDSVSRQMVYYENPLIGESLISRIPTGIYTSLFYLYLLVWPSELSFYYGFNEIPFLSWSSPYVYIGVLVFGLMMAVIFKFYRKNSFVVFGFLMLLLNIAAISNIYKPLPGVVAERFVFIGSIGFAMLTAFFLNKLYVFSSNRTVQAKIKKSVKYAYIICILLISSAYSYKTYARNGDWKNYSSLFLTDIQHLENSVKANDMATFHILTNLKSETDTTARREMFEDGIKYATQCVTLYPEHPQCWNNLGTLYFSQGRYDEAEECYLNSNLYNSEPEVNVLFNLGTIYKITGKTDQALEHFEAAIKINPDLNNLIPIYKQLLIESNSAQKGIDFLENLEEQILANYTVQLLLVDLYNTQENYSGMLIHLERAYQIQPSKEIETYIQQIKNYFNQ